MNASELRLFNYLQKQDGAVFQVSAERFVKISLGAMSLPPAYLPIPLTEEWLTKLGFEKIILKPVAPIWEEDIEWDLAGHRFSQDISGKWFLSGYHWNTEHFKYVHELQNLYFALTKQELVDKDHKA